MSVTTARHVTPRVQFLLPLVLFVSAVISRALIASECPPIGPPVPFTLAPRKQCVPPPDEWLNSFSLACGERVALCEVRVETDELIDPPSNWPFDSSRYPFRMVVRGIIWIDLCSGSAWLYPYARHLQDPRGPGQINVLVNNSKVLFLETSVAKAESPADSVQSVSEVRNVRIVEWNLSEGRLRDRANLKDESFFSMWHFLALAQIIEGRECRIDLQSIGSRNGRRGVNVHWEASRSDCWIDVGGDDVTSLGYFPGLTATSVVLRENTKSTGQSLKGIAYSDTGPRMLWEFPVSTIGEHIGRRTDSVHVVECDGRYAGSHLLLECRTENGEAVFCRLESSTGHLDAATRPGKKITSSRVTSSDASLVMITPVVTDQKREVELWDVRQRRRLCSFAAVEIDREGTPANLHPVAISAQGRCYLKGRRSIYSVDPPYTSAPVLRFSLDNAASGITQSDGTSK